MSQGQYVVSGLPDNKVQTACSINDLIFRGCSGILFGNQCGILCNIMVVLAKTSQATEDSTVYW